MPAGDPKAIAAVLLVSADDRRVLAACTFANADDAADVADTAGVLVATARKSLDRLRRVGMLDRGGVTELGQTVLREDLRAIIGD